MTDNKSPGDRLLELVVFAPTGLAVSLVEEFPKFVEKGRHRVEGQVHTARLVGQFAFQMGRRQLEQTIGHLAGHDDAPTVEPDVVRSAPEAPATEAPATEAPATEAPASRAPASRAPASEARVSTFAPEARPPEPRPPGAGISPPGHAGDDFSRRVFEPEIPTPGPRPGAAPAGGTRSESGATPWRAPVWLSGGPANGSGSPASLAIPGYDSLSASQVVQRLEGLSSSELEEVRRYEATHRQRRTILHRVEQLLSGGDSVPL
jgi:hypothetical protein